MSESFIYLDNNATTPLLSQVADAIHEIIGLPYVGADSDF
jgi:cysteine sulfinate desulfinase/cysteine desulfurase-like protein